MSAKVIDLQSYRKRKEEEKGLKNVRGLRAYNYSEDYTFGPDDLGEDFGVITKVDALRMMGLEPGEILDEQD